MRALHPKPFLPSGPGLRSTSTSPTILRHDDTDSPPIDTMATSGFTQHVAALEQQVRASHIDTVILHSPETLFKEEPSYRPSSAQMNLSYAGMRRPDRWADGHRARLSVGHCPCMKPRYCYHLAALPHRCNCRALRPLHTLLVPKISYAVSGWMPLSGRSCKPRHTKRPS